MDLGQTAAVTKPWKKYELGPVYTDSAPLAQI